MDGLLYNSVYTALPCLIAAYAAALYLTPRTISSRTAWSLGMLITTLLVAGAIVAMRGAAQPPLPLAPLVKAYVTLYALPFVVLTAAAMALRPRLHSRFVGIVVLILLALATNLIARYASSSFLDFVNAAG
jgi:hypothetical protein